MEISFFITAFAAIFVVVDPPGLAPLFLALTQDHTSSERKVIAIRACLISAITLTLFCLTGQAILDFIGISMPAFRISGGILLFLTAIDMLFERRTQRREDQASSNLDKVDPSVFPLSTPLIAGPGAITTIILLASEKKGEWLGTLTVIGVTWLIVLMTFVFMLIAPLLERILRRTGIVVVTRILGLLLAALSIQFVLDGISQSNIFDNSTPKTQQSTSL